MARKRGMQTGGQRQMNMKYAMRSEDTEQINVVSWANWNMNR